MSLFIILQCISITHFHLEMSKEPCETNSISVVIQSDFLFFVSIRLFKFNPECE